jgi:N-acetyl-anhydromuramyl-L-alanine amidase AmpD
VSAHFYVRRDGRVIQFVGCDQRAWHAGQSCWCERDNCNDYSVGIELEGSDAQPFTAEQYAALWLLARGRAIRLPPSPATAMSRPAARPTPARISTGRPLPPAMPISPYRPK